MIIIRAKGLVNNWMTEMTAKGAKAAVGSDFLTEGFLQDLISFPRGKYIFGWQKYFRGIQNTFPLANTPERFSLDIAPFLDSLVKKSTG